MILVPTRALPCDLALSDATILCHARAVIYGGDAYPGLVIRACNYLMQNGDETDVVNALRRKRALTAAAAPATGYWPTIIAAVLMTLALGHLAYGAGHTHNAARIEAGQ